MALFFKVKIKYPFTCVQNLSYGCIFKIDFELYFDSSQTAPNTPPAATSKVETNVKDEKKRQMDHQRKQAEEARRRHWHMYFLAKPNDLLTLDRNQVIVLKSVSAFYTSLSFMSFTYLSPSVNT